MYIVSIKITIENTHYNHLPLRLIASLGEFSWGFSLCLCFLKEDWEMKKRPGCFCTIPGYVLQITRSLLAELRIPIQGKRTWRLLFSLWPLSCTCNTMSPRLLNYLKMITFTLFIKSPALPTRIQPIAKSLVITGSQNKSVIKFIWQTST